MKVYSIFNTFLLLYIFQAINNSNVLEEVYANIGEDIVLTCRDEKASTSIWRRNGTLISDGSDINPTLNNWYKYKIIGDRSIGEYNLQILNITDDDLMTYWCEFQVNNFAIEKEVLVKLADYQSTVFIEEMITTDLTTQERTTTNVIISTTLSLHPTTDRNDVLSTHMPSTETITEVESTRNTESIKTEQDTDKPGFFSDDKVVYYGLLAIGLVVVLVLSVFLNVCINRKCKTEVVKIVNHGEIAGPTAMTLEMEDASSHYEFINDNDVLQLDMLHIAINKEPVPPAVSSKSSVKSTSSSENSYLEVIDDIDYLHPYQSINTDADALSENLHKYCKPSEIHKSKTVSSPEYEMAKQPEKNASSEKECMAEIIVNQINSSLLFQTTESGSEKGDDILVCDDDSNRRQDGRSTNEYEASRFYDADERHEYTTPNKPNDIETNNEGDISLVNKEHVTESDQFDIRTLERRADVVENKYSLFPSNQTDCVNLSDDSDSKHDEANDCADSKNTNGFERDGDNDYSRP